MKQIKKLIATDKGRNILSNVSKIKNVSIINSYQFYNNVLIKNGMFYNNNNLCQVIRLTVDYLRLQCLETLNLTYQQYEDKYRFQIHKNMFDKRIGLFYFKKFSIIKKMNLNLTDDVILNILQICYKENDGRKNFN